MRSKIYFLTILVVLVWGCTENKTPDEALLSSKDCTTCEANLLAEHTKLETYEIQANYLAETLERLNSNYVEIEKKLRIIQKFKNDKVHEKELRKTADEINAFFIDSHNSMDSLSMRIGMSNFQSEAVSRIIGTIKQHLWNQEELFIEVYGSIEAIKTQITSLKSKVKTANTLVDSKEAELASKVKEVNTVYYVLGGKKDLARAKVIKTKGGLLGLGGSVQLSDKFENQFFTTADLNKLTEIDCGNIKKRTLVTSHPKDSYFFLETAGIVYLKITNPEKFWSSTKYMVLLTD